MQQLGGAGRIERRVIARRARGAHAPSRSTVRCAAEVRFGSTAADGDDDMLSTQDNEPLTAPPELRMHERIRERGGRTQYKCSSNAKVERSPSAS